MAAFRLPDLSITMPQEAYQLMQDVLTYTLGRITNPLLKQYFLNQISPTFPYMADQTRNVNMALQSPVNAVNTGTDQFSPAWEYLMGFPHPAGVYGQTNRNNVAYSWQPDLMGTLKHEMGHMMVGEEPTRRSELAPYSVMDEQGDRDYWNKMRSSGSYGVWDYILGTMPVTQEQMNLLNPHYYPDPKQLPPNDPYKSLVGQEVLLRGLYNPTVDIGTLTPEQNYIANEFDRFLKYGPGYGER